MPSLPAVERSLLRLACLLVILSAIGASGCTRNYLDVTSLLPKESPDAEAAAADGESCRSEAGCPTTAAGWALQFDGIASCARSLRPVSKDFTLEAWVMLDATGSGSYWWDGLPLFWADLDAQASDFSATVLNGKLWFVTGSPGGDEIIPSKSTIPTSQWVHIAITRVMSTGAVALFIDGQAAGSGTGTTVALTGQSNMWILCSNTGLYTPGAIDELRAWSVARGEADIRATMHERLAGDEPGLVGYWRLDEGLGTSATDSSPTGNPLNLGGAAPQTAPAWIPSTVPTESS